MTRTQAIVAGTIATVLLTASCAVADSKSAAGGPLGYPKQAGPLGYGIFEKMHWKQMKSEPQANIQNPYLAGAMFHVPWSALEPSRGQLDTKIVDEWLAAWGTAGKKIMLHVKTSPGGPKERNPWKSTSTPTWVYEARARFVESNKKGAQQRLPLVWDPIFLKEYERFLTELAKRYDGHPAIELIVVGPGAFGSTRVGYPETMREFLAAGYSDRRWSEAVLQIVGLYKNAFPKTPLALGVSPFWRNEREEPVFNHLVLAKTAAERGLYLYYHNLRGTEQWTKSPYPRFFAALSATTKVALGLDNPSSVSESHQQKYGDPVKTVQYAFGNVDGLPAINTAYIVLYEADVEAATRGSKSYRQPYEEAMRWALARITRKEEAAAPPVVTENSKAAPAATPPEGRKGRRR